MMPTQLTSWLLFQNAAAHHREVEIVSKEGDVVHRHTYGDFARRAQQLMHALDRLGIAPGDRVATLAWNHYRHLECYFAVPCTERVLHTLNVRLSVEDLAYIIEHADDRAIFVDPDLVPTLEKVAALGPALARVKHLIVLAAEVPASTLPNLVSYEALIRDEPVSYPRREIDEDTAMGLCYTSGTTGRPKGAMLTHGASVKAYDTWSTVVGLRAGDRYLIVNPFFHAFGLKAGILASLIKGATIVPHAVFDVEAVMQRVAEEHISMLPGPPTIYQSILDHPRAGEFDLSSLRLAVTGAAPVPMELIRRMREELKFENVVRGFGLTEATGIATMCRHDDPAEWISETEGRAIPGTELRIVDDDNQPVATDEAGEVVIRGYNVMQGFLDDPEATAEAIDGDGWLHTGDIGTVDANGNLRITDRKKDMFIVGGFNAYPAEIENMISDHPAVSQVAIVGVPDTRLGEVGYAFVVTRPDQSVDADELIAWCRERMANYKVPRHVQVVDALPLNASGKVLKFELRDRATR